MKAKKLLYKLRTDVKSAKTKFKRIKRNKILFKSDQKPPETFSDKTFLFIPAFTGDNGMRPLPPGTAYWNSPAIEIYDSANNLIAANQMTKGNAYKITVDVWNEGDMTCNSCIVELFICSLSVGFNVANASQIGLQNIIINGHSTFRTEFSFTPGASNVGHQCLFARAYSFIDGDLPLSSTDFLVVEDRHIGQQNLSIIGQMETFTFNIFPMKADMNQDFRIRVKKKTTKPAILKTASFAKYAISKTIEVTDKFVFANLLPPAPSDIKLKKVTKDKWDIPLAADVNKMQLTLPKLSLKAKEIAVFDVEITGVKTNRSLGGFTIIVKP